VSSAISKTVLYSFSFLFLVAAGAFVYWDQTIFLLLPPVLLAIVALLQYPSLLIYALLLSIPWSIEYNFNSSLGTDLPDEPLMLLGALAALCYFVSYGKSIDRQRFLHPLVLIVLIQFAWTTITIITSADIVLSLKYVLAKGWYLLAFVALPLFAWKRPKEINHSAAILTWSMLAFMALTIIRHSQYNFTFEKINTALEPFYRNHVNYSALLAFTVPLQVAAIQLTRSRWLRAFLILALIVCLGALYFSYARGAWLALIVCVAGYWMIRRRLLVYAYAFFILASTAAVGWLVTNDNYLRFSNDFNSTVFHTNFSEHLAATYSFQDASTAERFYRWVAGGRMVEDSWKTGLGPSTFYTTYRSYTQPAFKTWVSGNEEHSTVHNYFLLLIIEQGVFGLLFFLLLLGALFWYAQAIYHRTGNRYWKIVTAAVSGVLLMECAINFLSDMIETDKAGSVFYLSLAVLVIADLQTRREKELHNS